MAVIELPQYKMKHTPFAHQRDEWKLSRELTARAVLWEQGTGKSKLTIDSACWSWMRGKIDTVVVVAPNGVHRNWVDTEMVEHVPDELWPVIRAHFYQSQRADTKWHQRAVQEAIEHKGFLWFTISYDAFMTKRGKAALIEIFSNRRVFYVLDEAHNIKGMDTDRTTSILKSAKYAEMRRILTGTPIAVGPFDLYPQLEFLDPTFWPKHGFSSFVSFRRYFGVYKKWVNPNAYNKRTGQMGVEVDLLVNYRNLDRLEAIVKEISTRVVKDEVLDLPQKLYQRRLFTMSPEQARLYREMKEECIAWIQSGQLDREVEIARKAAAEQVDMFEEPKTCPACGGAGEIEQEGFIYPCPECWTHRADSTLGDTTGLTPIVAKLAIVKMLRLQQITCGYLPTDDSDEPMHIIPGPNPRLMALCDEIEGDRHKTIVWARFQLDITQIIEELTRRGIKCGRYDGLTSDDERSRVKEAFQGVRAIIGPKGEVLGREKVPEDEQLEVFVGNPAAGATGLTLTAAHRVIYYSNSFKLIDRLQSEDRAHRIGQTNHVLYLDLEAEDTIDGHIIRNLRGKFDIARQITGDRMKDWI